jgi:SMC interacting uncharacterized protein involved in chromosome segregation
LSSEKEESIRSLNAQISDINMKNDITRASMTSEAVNLKCERAKLLKDNEDLKMQKETLINQIETLKSQKQVISDQTGTRIAQLESEVESLKTDLT